MLIKENSIFKKVTLGSISIGVSASCFAATPLWILTPAASSQTTQTLSAKDNAVVQYIVRNQSNRFKNLVIKAIPGVKQTAPCQLAPTGQTGSQCILNLALAGSALPANGIQGGPSLCQANANGTPNPNQCYQPSADNALKISLSDSPPIPQSIISTGTQTSLMLGTVAPNNKGIITVSNTSAVPALNIKADVSAANGTLNTPEYSNSCIKLLAGEEPCTITFTANSPMSSKIIPIKGDNTNSINITISIDQSTLSILPTSLMLQQNGPEQRVVVTNTGPVAAYNVTGTLIDQTQNVNLTFNDCPDGLLPLAVNQSCQLGFTQSGTYTANTSATIAGSNTTTPPLLLPIRISPLLTIGDAYGGGVIYNIDGNTAYILSLIDILPNSSWGQVGQSVATSSSNTFNITTDNTYTALAGDSFGAAAMCRNYDEGSGTNTWFLPAQNEWPLVVANINTINDKSVITGFNQFTANSEYWSSTQVSDTVGAFTRQFSSSSSSSQLSSFKSNTLKIRCVKALLF